MDNEFTHEETGTRMTVRKPNVLEHLTYLEKISRGYVAAWNASRPFVDEWECDLMPDKDTDLTTITDTRVSTILLWAAGRVADYFMTLGDVEKNT